MSTAEAAASVRARWKELLSISAREVFSMMAASDLLPPQFSNVPVIAEVSGMVGIAGAISATFLLRCSRKSALTIAARMLGVAADQAELQRYDAIGEICNMCAGQFKAKIGLEAECMLSVPTVISGRNYELHSRVDYDRLELPLMLEGEAIWVAVDVRR